MERVLSHVSRRVDDDEKGRVDNADVDRHRFSGLMEAIERGVTAITATATISGSSCTAESRSVRCVDDQSTVSSSPPQHTTIRSTTVPPPYIYASPRSSLPHPSISKRSVELSQP